MEREEKVGILLTPTQDGGIAKREITQEELDRIFFKDGNRNWDNIYQVLPEPVWEKIFDEEGCLGYEGYTLDHKAFGAGRTFRRDGTLRTEGVYGLKGLLCGREYYPNGRIRFEGSLRLNQAYGPNFPEFGSWYDEDGKLLFRGKFRFSRSSLGWPTAEEPEGFRWDHGSLPKGHVFLWEDARKYMKEAVLSGQEPEQEKKEDRNDE